MPFLVVIGHYGSKNANTDVNEELRMGAATDDRVWPVE